DRAILGEEVPAERPNSLLAHPSVLARFPTPVTASLAARHVMAVITPPERAADLDALRDEARRLRCLIVDMTTKAGSGHPSSSFSCVELLTGLFFTGILRHDPKNPHWPDRDRFIMSKGHAVPALYAVLAEQGYFPEAELQTLRQLDSRLEGHPN